MGGGGGDSDSDRDSAGGAGFVQVGRGVEAKGQGEGQGGWRWTDVFGAAWLVLSWVGWGLAGLVKVLQAVLVLATLQTNLTVRIMRCVRSVYEVSN